MPLTRTRNQTKLLLPVQKKPEVEATKDLEKETNQKLNSDSSRDKETNKPIQIKNHKSVLKAARLILEDVVNGGGRYSKDDIKTFEKISTVFLKAFSIEDARKEVRRLNREIKKH